jgi:hypothetical protein
MQKQVCKSNKHFKLSLFLKGRRLKVSLAKPFNQRDFNTPFFQKGGTDVLDAKASLQKQTSILNSPFFQSNPPNPLFSKRGD